MKKTFKEFASACEEVLKLQGVPEEKLCEPIQEGKWSVREIIGHLYYWDKFNLERMLPDMHDGADLRKFPDHDEHNAEAISFLQDEPVEAIVDRFVETRQVLTGKLVSLDGNMRFTIGGGKRKLSVESFTKIFVKHDTHHLKQIAEKLSEN
ncbi:DinB family protein [Evansella cellulosilytica]|uniref:DinB-like domain-containing protein n=1 Tax=Evansella cellulosilytica (strain ATCC 21833 / DSM 2522 / FERM P-1141 / JCM 9156 / N-4) TaxID=649639 RepID=E6TWJ3_EVAC2|nr:DinB family protein [Evansella cellulosilytica]ADU32256.1 hypothetical protein Bcell_4025 [Evansella cellulosilytica DSM 2522]